MSRLLFSFLLLGAVTGTALAQPRKVPTPKETNGLPLLFEDDFSKGSDRWQPGDPKAWRVDKVDLGFAYYQFGQSKVKNPHRSPFNFSYIKDLVVTDFEFAAAVKSTGKDNAHRDMCLFFGYQDPAHLYYVHIAKKADDHANQIFIVNGADRKKISIQSTEGTPWDDAWHQVRIQRNTATGRILVFFNGKNIMTAEDKTFLWGQVGIGSFDDTGLWTDVRLWGHAKK